MLTNKAKLIDLFQSANSNEDVNYICVRIEIKDCDGEIHTESIVFHRREFSYKLNYYLNAYDTDLRLKANDNIRIKSAMSCTNTTHEKVRMMYTF